METKTILQPEAFADLMFRKFGGEFFTRSDEPITGLAHMEFHMGDEGKREKLDASQRGIVIVQRGIVTTLRKKYRQILVSERLPSQHVVTRGGSILVSGDADNDPEQILRSKLIVHGDIDGDFTLLGYGLSAPAQTKGIKYLFEVFNLRLRTLLDVKAGEGKDPVRFQTLNEAARKITGKPLEEKILKEVRSTF
jgi:hypothetical protein